MQGVELFPLLFSLNFSEVRSTIYFLVILLGNAIAFYLILLTLHLIIGQSLGRKRQSGGGRKKDAKLLCRLLVTLLYVRQHWTMQALGEAIGCAESVMF